MLISPPPHSMIIILYFKNKIRVNMERNFFHHNWNSQTLYNMIKLWQTHLPWDSLCTGQDHSLPQWPLGWLRQIQLCSPSIQFSQAWFSFYLVPKILNYRIITGTSTCIQNNIIILKMKTNTTTCNSWFLKLPKSKCLNFYHSFYGNFTIGKFLHERCY